VFLDVSEMNGDAGDHKGPPNPASSTLAPTDVNGIFLRLMLIGDRYCIPQMRGPTASQGAVVPGFPDRVPLGTLLH
jgi:hypothetical protein